MPEFRRPKLHEETMRGQKLILKMHRKIIDDSLVAVQFVMVHQQRLVTLLHGLCLPRPALQADDTIIPFSAISAVNLSLLLFYHLA